MASVEDKVMQILPNFTKAALDSMSEVTSIICKLLEERREDKIAQDILGYANDGGALSFMAFDEVVGNDFKKALSLAGVSFVEGQADNGTKSVLFIKDCDKELAKQTKRDVLLNRGKINELTVEEMLNKSYGQKLGVIKEVDDVSMARLRQRAKESNIVFAAEKSKSGKNNIYYDVSDKKMMNYVLFRANWDLNGKVGKENTRQILYDLNQKKEFNELLNRKDERYIVSASNPQNYIYISDKGLDVFENERLKESRERMSDDFDIYANYQHERLKNPVCLTKEEFYSIDVVRVIKERNNRPIISQETRNLWKKEEKLRELVEAKMSLDNGYQVENISSLYNGEVGFREFFEHERVNDEHEQEERQRVLEDIREEEITIYIEHIRSTIDAQEVFEYETISVDDKSIESIINELAAEKEVSIENIEHDKSR